MALAIGFVNTLGAPIIKKYAPNHIALMTGLLSLCMSIFAGVIAWGVLPLAQTIGWRFSMGLWAIFGILTVGIWIIISKHHKQDATITPPPMDSLMLGKILTLGCLRHSWAFSQCYFMAWQHFYQ